jgi:hypothetical protein
MVSLLVQMVATLAFLAAASAALSGGHVLIAAVLFLLGIAIVLVGEVYER